MIVVCGTVCLDRIRRVPSLPVSGGYVPVESEAYRLGGEAANSAAHLVRWGAPCTLLGNSIAGDADGILVESFLAERGLAYGTRAEEVERTPACDVYVTPDGERTMFGLGFANLSLPPVAGFNPSIGSLFTLDGNLGPTGDAYAEKARDAGMRLYLMDLPGSNKLLGHGVVWQSSTRWFGTRGDREANESLVQELVDRTQCTAILTDSGNGLLAASPSSTVRVYPTFPRPEVADPTGSGDALRAGVLYGLSHGWEFGECLSFGAAAAALAAGSIGAAEGPSLAAVESHLAANAKTAGQYE